MLQIRRKDGQTAEDLLPDSLKNLPNEIEYKSNMIVFSKLSDVTEAEFYTRALSKMLNCYLETTKLDKFIDLYLEYKEDTKGRFWKYIIELLDDSLHLIVHLYGFSMIHVSCVLSSSDSIAQNYVSLF